VVAFLRLAGRRDDRMFGARLGMPFENDTKDQQRGSGYEQDRHDPGNPPPPNTDGRRG
jgi:hypothetical protein